NDVGADRVDVWLEKLSIPLDRGFPSFGIAGKDLQQTRRSQPPPREPEARKSKGQRAFWRRAGPWFNRTSL
ncbi:hypothetical protein B8W95_14090, partial [Staphylococcus pasteuri]